MIAWSAPRKNVVRKLVVAITVIIQEGLIFIQMAGDKTNNRKKKNVEETH
jgi:hypothetical protein